MMEKSIADCILFKATILNRREEESKIKLISFILKQNLKNCSCKWRQSMEVAYRTKLFLQKKRLAK